MNTTLKQLNTFVQAFLHKNSNASNMDKLWMKESTQKQLKTLLVRASKPPKDPNAPKRGKSAYLYFCEDNRKKVMSELGKNVNATDVTRELGARWNELKKDKKRAGKLKEYERRALADKERYEKEKAAYVPPKHLYSKTVKKGPKRAKSAYLYFCSANRKEVKNALGKGVKATEVTKELGARWNTLKAEGGTEEFDKLAEKDRKRYSQEKEEFQKRSDEDDDDEEGELVEESPKKVRKKNVPKKKVKKTVSKKEVKKAPKKASKKASKKTSRRSGYQVFCKENREQYKKDSPDANAKEITKQLSAAWKSLSKEEQDRYKNSPASA